MPLVDAGFTKADGLPDFDTLYVYGPTVQVTVGHYSPDPESPPAAPKPSKAVHALVDTGAYQSCIDSDLAVELGLPVIDKQLISGASGAQEHDVYMAHVTIPGLEFVQYGRFTGVNLKAGGQEHSVLLGRTFLRSVIMIYDGIRAQVTIASARLT